MYIVTQHRQQTASHPDDKTHAHWSCVLQRAARRNENARSCSVNGKQKRIKCKAVEKSVGVPQLEYYYWE